MTSKRVLESQLHTGDHRASPPESPRIAGTCPKCRHLGLVAACSRAGCGARVAICWGCPDVAEEFTASGGLCLACRPPETTAGSTDRAAPGDGHPSSSPGASQVGPGGAGPSAPARGP